MNGKPKILILDQSVKSREAIRDILLQDEYETETAESAEEGLDLIASRQFDVLVTDLPLSSMGRSGWLHSGPPEAAEKRLGLRPRHGHGGERDIVEHLD